MLIESQVEARKWQPIHTSRSDLSFSYLLFADDVLLFTKTRDKQAQVINTAIT